MTKQLRVGVISDTHGLVRPEVLEALRGVDHIVHAGDIGKPEVLSALRELAPVTAIRGNTDRDPWARALADTEVLRLQDSTLYVVHNLADLNLDPHAAGFTAVIAGHSHQPWNIVKDGVLFFNPGSAGPRRFRLPVALGRLLIEGKSISGNILIIET